MKNNLIEQASFSVLGIEARTNNKAELSGTGIIGQQWEKFMKQNQSTGPIIAAYTEYESDKDGDYTFFIGTQVDDGTTIPDGMVLKTVPAGKYSIVKTERGEIWNIVQTAWKNVWNDTSLKRNYKFDYEVYDEGAKNPSDAQINIFVGIV